MDVRTNLTWPDDPYRTGQQLYRRPVPRLAAFAVIHDGAVPAAAAIVYLPLHRTKTLRVTEQTLAFGFRVACADAAADLPALAEVADLDLMQARRHAAILAGHQLAPDLAFLRCWAGTAVLRGLESVEREWANRCAASGRASMFDTGLDLPGQPSLEDAGCQARIETSLASGDQLSMQAVERALVIALVCARHLGRYEWAGLLGTGEVLAAAAWDCLAPSSAGNR